MKTGMELPLVGLVILVGLVVLWNTWSNMQVDLSVAALNAAAAGEAAPEPVMIAGQWIVKALVGVVLGGFVTAGIAALIVWVRRQWVSAQGAERWHSGPNARWGREPRQPRAPSEAELMRMMMMQQMAQGGRPAGVPPVTRLEDQDEPIIRF